MKKALKRALALLLALSVAIAVLPQPGYATGIAAQTSSSTAGSTKLKTPVLTAVVNINGGIRISWEKVARAAKYRVFAKTGNGGWKRLADTTRTSYTWKDAKPGVKYSFTVRCVSGNGKYYTSSYNTKGESIRYIAAPVLNAVQNTGSGIKISWSKSKGAAKYRVYYKIGNGQWKKLTDTKGTSYTWTKATAGKQYTFTVRCITNNGKNTTSGYDTRGISIQIPTRVGAAKQTLKTETKNAKYKYSSKNLLVTITEKDTVSGGSCLLTHVIINDPSQMKGALSNNTLGGEREKPSAASRRIKSWVVGTNGSYFNYEYGEPTMYAHVLIHGGKVYRDYTSGTTGHEICKRNDGTLFTPKTGLRAADLLRMGVTDIWGTCDPVLIENKRLNRNLTGRNPERNPRTGIGMVRPGEYYLLTSNTGNYHGGLSYSECQKIFADLGCSYARTLDGGGSSSLAFNGKLINKTATGTERPVADFLYFTAIAASNRQ